MKSIKIKFPGEIKQQSNMGGIREGIRRVLGDHDINIYFIEVAPGFKENLPLIEIEILPSKDSNILPQSKAEVIIDEVARCIPWSAQYKVSLLILEKEFPRGGGI